MESERVEKMSQQDLCEQLYGAFKHRAQLYYLIFDEMRQEFGADKAEEILKRAIYKRGLAVGQKYSQYGPNDLEGLKDAFTAGIPDGGKMFAPQVKSCDAEGLDIHLMNCPLKDAWQEAGLGEDDVATMCRIAAAIDGGTFEAAGFEFSAETWQPGCDGCCQLHIRPGTTD